MDFKFQRRRLNEIPNSKILEDLEKAAEKFSYIEFGWRDFDRISTVSAKTVKNHYGSWKKGLEALKVHLQSKGKDLLPRPFAPNRVISDRELFDEMERIWKLVGQRPSGHEWEISNPKYAYSTYQSRFGGWTKACLKFMEYKLGKDILSDDFILPTRKLDISPESKVKFDRSLSRSVSLTLRLQILNRDNFKCVLCGKSPATDLGTRIHIDHIIPFSKGGKSTFENLQTLCFECNLGKSNTQGNERGN